MTLPTRPILSPGSALPALLLLVSGMVALVYEGLWQRQFALVFGSAAPATAAVLAAYFAGLGLGAVVLGRIAPRVRKPLRLYSLLEACVGLSALLVEPLLTVFGATYSQFYEELSTRPALFTSVRMGFAFLVLLVPTFCMGGTLPLLGQWLDRDGRHLGRTAGLLYVANTVGAGLGALALPFVLLPQFGMRGSLAVSAITNLALAGLAYAMHRRLRRSTSRVVPQAHAEQSTVTKAAVEPGKSLPVAFLALTSGLVTFALQVLWNRAFAQVHENSMYSFAVTVALVVFALAAGAQLCRAALARGLSPRRVLGSAWIPAGLLLLAGPHLFVSLSGGLDYLADSGGWAAHGGRLAVVGALILVLPTLLLGVSFPSVLEEAGRRGTQGSGRVIGSLLAWNVVGSVVGALLPGFVLPGFLGMWDSVHGLGLLVLFIGTWALVDSLRWRIGFLTTAAGGGVLLIFVADLPRTRVEHDQGERLLAVDEGTHGVTAVVERPGSRRLKLNNHYALGGTASAGDERMQAHLPLLLHPRPDRVAFLGLGTGITAGAALLHPVREIIAIEVVPEVVEAARLHFGAENAGIVTDPRARVVVDDARNFLRGTRERFDVIIGDLVVPWRLGEGALLTQEQFVAARSALKPGGVFCQWLPLFQLSEAEFTMIARTFLSVFPDTQVWRGDFSPTQPALALVGFTSPPRQLRETVELRLQQMAKDASNPHLHTPEVVWMHGVGRLLAAHLDPSETRLNREDRPWVELLGPWEHAGAATENLFIGRRLHTWLYGLRQRAETTEISDGFERGRAAGEALSEQVLSLSEGDTAAAQAAHLRLRALLPHSALPHFAP